MAELKYRERHNELVTRDAVHKAQFAAGRQVREVLMNTPDRSAGIFAAEGDQETIYALLTKELRQALEDLIDAA